MLVAAAGGEQEVADRPQAAGALAHLFLRLAQNGGFRPLVAVAEPGGQFHEHRIDAGGEGGEAELLDQHHRVGARVVGQERRRPAAAPQLPPPRTRHRAVEAALAEAHHLQREAALPDGLGRIDRDIGVRGQGEGGGHGGAPYPRTLVRSRAGRFISGP